MNPTVVARRQRPFDFQLLLQIRFELRVNVVDDRFERIVLVDLITISNGVADGQLQAYAFLLQLVRMRFELHIGQCMGARLRFEASVEQCVH